jgi:5-methylcytosine-specific restriction endonuclease McrA
MASLIQIITKADTYMWLQGLLRNAANNERDGLVAAIAGTLKVYYQPSVVGSVASDENTDCMKSGVCQLSDQGYKSLEGLRNHLSHAATQREQVKMEQAFSELSMKIVRSRLRATDVSLYRLEDVVTTILPMCSVCWETQNLHLDHVIPKSKGGLNDYSNYQLLCAGCNSSKNDKDMKEWHEWVNTSEDERASAIRLRRATNRAETLNGTVERKVDPV